MYALSHKTKQIFFLLIKLFIVIGAFYFIYHQIRYNPNLNFHHFITIIDKNAIFSFINLLVIITLSVLNWHFEIKKWQLLTTTLKPLTYTTALKQTLSSFTAALFSPNKIADYPAKILHFKKPLRKRVFVLNVLNNLSQMCVTTVFGLLGSAIFLYTYTVTIAIPRFYFFILVCIIFLIGIIFSIQQKHFEIKGFSLKKLSHFLTELTASVKIKLFLFAVIRYLAFSFQFYFLLLCFKIKVDYANAMVGITTMYFFSSILPLLSLFDVVIKGSIALFVFKYYAIDASVIACTILIMWLFNTVLPSLIGSYYVLLFPLKSKPIAQ